MDWTFAAQADKFDVIYVTPTDSTFVHKGLGISIPIAIVLSLHK